MGAFFLAMRAEKGSGFSMCPFVASRKRVIALAGFDTLKNNFKDAWQMSDDADIISLFKKGQKMKLEKRISYYVDGKQLWSYKDLAKKYDISLAVARYYVNNAEFALTRPTEIARTGEHAQAVVLFNAEELDKWFEPKAEKVRKNIERRVGRPRKK